MFLYTETDWHIYGNLLEGNSVLSGFAEGDVDFPMGYPLVI